jgi:hypothetical protein
MLVTPLRYRQITGDQDAGWPAVSGWINEAVERLEDTLDRKLEEAERTERMFPTRDGSLWPHALPIIAAAGYTIDGNRLIGTWLEPVVDLITGHTRYREVTYTGGWVERTANPDAANRLPTCIEEDVAVAAYLIGHPIPFTSQSAVPVGAVSVSLGDASVNFGPRGAQAARPTTITWSRKTLGYRYQRIGGDTC